MTTTPDQSIYSAEYFGCGARTHEDRHRCAENAVELERAKCAGHMKGDPRPENRGGHTQRSKAVDKPANAASLREAAEAAACRHYGITLNRLRAGHSGAPRWWVVTALTFIPGGGHPNTRKGILGGVRARLILESATQLQWAASQLQRADKTAYRAAVVFGATLVAEWGTTT